MRKVSEWITGHLGHGAVGGEELERNQIRVLVRKVRLQQVLEAQITRRPNSQRPEEIEELRTARFARGNARDLTKSRIV